MLTEIGYDRRKAVQYALNWAYSRNPRFYDFENIGGDCTNFVSQCLYAGSGVMNFSADNGWYYIDIDNRAPAWTGAQFLRDFLLTNKGEGVYGEEAPPERLSRGDVIQFRDPDGRIYHSMIISYIMYPAVPQNIFVCAHSFDARNRRLSSYDHFKAEGIHIIGARREIPIAFPAAR